MVDTVLNHYRITRALGRGGMGEVYEAEDTTLHRLVAVKVLAPAVADDPARRQRFEREARAIAALNHPNIVTIHSIEQAGERLFLTMELVHGRTLSRLIPAHGLPLAQLLQFAIPLADAFSAAHRQGIVHRDLKPDNVMVTDDGRVKVLDFGLAQLKRVGPDGDAITTLQSQQLTAEGHFLGSVAYMSPEQAQGRDVDARSDIFSLGIVLFEMASGERPFRGDSTVSILSSIVKDPAPSITAINPAIPGEFARIVRRTLAKDPSRRYQTATDVRNDLEDLEHEIESGPTSAVPVDTGRANRVREALAWSVAAVLLVTALIALVDRKAAVDAGPDVLSVLPPENTTLTDGEAPLVSPDGRLIAFVATDSSGRTRLYVRDRGSLDARPLADSDDATLPFWSPDSRSLAFFASGWLKRISVSGGRPQTLALAPVPRGGTWSPGEVIVFVPFPEQPPQRVDAAGGPVTALPIGPDELRWFPSFLPDGRHYVYLDFRRGQSHGIHVGSIEGPDRTPLVPTNTSATYVDSGHLIFRREESLVAQRFNASTRQLEDAPVVVADQVSFNPITQQTLASASSGILAYSRAGQRWQLTWFDLSGRRLSHAGTIGGYNSLCLASDGRRVVYDVADTKSGNVDLWSRDLIDGTTARLTFHPAADFYVACSPSSDEVIFTSPRTGTPNLHRLALSSPGNETSLGLSPLPTLPSQWSRDGRLLFSAFSQKTDFDVWILPLPDGQPSALVATEAAEKGAQLSPNSRWIAYASGQAGNYDVYVQPFPVTGSRWQISQGGGRQPQWRPDGQQLFYISPDKKLVAVDVDGSAPQFVVGASRVLVDTRVGGWERTHLGNPYAVSADGKRLLVANADEATLPLTVMLNWQSSVSGGRR